MNKKFFSLLIIYPLLLFAVEFHSFKQASQGPGLGNLAYTSAELFKPIGVFNSANGAPLGHGHVTMHNGYLALILAHDSGNKGGGFAFFDVSNPRNPQLVFQKLDAQTEGIREGHGYGITRMNGKDLVALQTIEGIQIWDWTDVMNPLLLSDLDLPGVVESDYDNGAWWIHFQAPYIYLGASSNGTFIIDAKDPAAPFTVKHLPISQTGQFRVGPIYAMGNLLVMTSMDAFGIATMDISDPENPVLKDTDIGSYVYSALVNGNYIIAPGADLRVHTWDISDPSNIKTTGISPFLTGVGAYANFQDGFIHTGMSSDYHKLDFHNPNNITKVGQAKSGIPDTDHDFAAVLGNLVFVGNDHGTGSALIVHQINPDVTPPSVNRVVPAPEAVNQAITSRVGISFTDMIDFTSVNEQNFVVRPFGGSPLPGIYSNQFGILNFHPEQPLQPNTVYEVVLPAGGIKDYVGNALDTQFISRFSTGTSLNLLQCSLTETAFIELGSTSYFEADVFNNSGTVSYTWNFGDGNTSAPSADPFAYHQYQNVGNYSVILNINDGSYQSSCNILHTVIERIDSGSTSVSSTILIDKTGSNVWNVNPDNNSVTKINAHALTFSEEFSVGNNPVSLAEDNSGNIWVVNKGDATINILNNSGGLVKIISLPRGSQPSAIVISPNGQKAYVSLFGLGEVAKLDVANQTVEERKQVGSFPKGLALTRDNQQLFVTEFITIGDSAEVMLLNAQTLEVTKRIKLAPDFAFDSEISGKGIPNYLNSIVLSPDGGSALIPAKKDNIFRGLKRDGEKLNFENTVRPMLAKINLSSRSEDLASRIDINNGDIPAFAIYSKLGNLVFASLQGNDKVVVIDVFQGTTLTSIDNVGTAPQGLTLSLTGDTLFVHNFLSRTISVYDVSQLVNQTSAAVTKLKEISLVKKEAMNATVLKGKKIFYNANDIRMSKDKYLSCATCHLDGDHDGRVFDLTQLGEGLRNTIPLRGRGATGQGNVHWTGNFDELQDFEGQIRDLAGGNGFMDDVDYLLGHHNQSLEDKKAGLSDDLDALAAYVASLDKFDESPYRNEDGTLTAAGERGKNIFANLECGMCHSGSNFTDSETKLFHDIGTIKPTSGTRMNKQLLGFDTPTMKDIWLNPPYLHDGSANTLTDALLSNNGQLFHSDASQLSQQDLDDLIAYLLQIDGSENGTYPFMDLRITAPENYSMISTHEAVNIKVETDLELITEVQYYVDGEKFATTSSINDPVSYSFATVGEYKIQAKVFHDGGKFASLTAETKVTVLDDCNLKIDYMPNPVSEKLRIDLNGVNSTKVQVFDLSGKKWVEGIMEGTSEVWDLSDLPHGVYFLRIEKEGCRVTKKILRYGYQE